MQLRHVIQVVSGNISALNDTREKYYGKLIHGHVESVFMTGGQERGRL